MAQFIWKNLIATANHVNRKEAYCYPRYASPSSGEAYRDRRLVTNFDLKFFCVPTCFHNIL